MASVAAKPAFVRKAGTFTASLSSKWKVPIRKSEAHTQLLCYATVRASHPMDDKDKVSKQLGLFSLSILLPLCTAVGIYTCWRWIMAVKQINVIM